MARSARCVLKSLKKWRKKWRGCKKQKKPYKRGTVVLLGTD